MNYLSFRAGVEGKVSKQNIKGLTGHTLRKTEGRYNEHSNEDIDRTRTHLNVDWTKDGKKIEDIINERLENEYKGKRVLRKDAVVMREVITQASSNIYENLTDDEKIEKAIKFTEDTKEWLVEEFGSENVIGYSIHLDETNPHTHFMIMPMTQDGRLSQKDFFRGPSGLKRQHREYREHMNVNGWNFEMENKYENVDSFSLPAYKANAERIEQMRQSQKERIEELSDTDLVHTLVMDRAIEKVKENIYENVLSDELSRIELLESDYKARMLLLEEREEELKKEKQKTLEERINYQEYKNRLKHRESIIDKGLLMITDGNEKLENFNKHIREKGVGKTKVSAIHNAIEIAVKDADRERRDLYNNDFKSIVDDGPEL